MIDSATCFHRLPCFMNSEGHEDHVQLGEYPIKYILLRLVGYLAVGPLTILQM